MKFEVKHPDKVLFPKDKITKEDLLEYYTLVASRILPLIKSRPIMMKRYVEGIDKSAFVQKQVPSYFPKWIDTATVKREGKSSIKMPLINSKDALLYLVNQGCITPHIWQSQSEELNCPNRLVFDLDPPKGGFSLAAEGAKFIREVLERDYKLKSYLMTTGRNGLHLIVTIKPDHPFEAVREFAKSVGGILESERPNEFTISPRKPKRVKRVYIEYLRNGYAQTSFAPYAIRATTKAPIAMPIGWDELKKGRSMERNAPSNLKNLEK